MPTRFSFPVPPCRCGEHPSNVRRYKLFRYTDEFGTEEEMFFDLWNDPCEQKDLCPELGPCDPGRLSPEQALNCLALQAELVAMGMY